MSPLRRASPHPTIMTLPELNYFPKVPSPQTISLGVRESTCELWRAQHSSVHSSVLSSVLFLILGVSLPIKIMSLLLFLHAIVLLHQVG